MRQIHWAPNSRQLGKSTKGSPLDLWPGALCRSAGLISPCGWCTELDNNFQKQPGRVKRAEAGCFCFVLFCFVFHGFTTYQLHALGQATWPLYFVARSIKMRWYCQSNQQSIHVTSVLLWFPSHINLWLIYLYAFTLLQDLVLKASIASLAWGLSRFPFPLTMGNHHHPSSLRNHFSCSRNCSYSLSWDCFCSGKFSRASKYLVHLTNFAFSPDPWCRHFIFIFIFLNPWWPNFKSFKTSRKACCHWFCPYPNLHVLPDHKLGHR